MIQWIKNYIASPTHQWWVENIWKPSWTRFLSLIYGIPSALIVGGQYLSGLAGDTHITDLLHQMNLPDGVFVGLAGIALLHYLAHGRD